jgi:hypothetical protein
MVAGSHASPLDNDVNEEILTGRKYIVIRAIGDSSVRFRNYLHILITALKSWM